MSPATAPYFSPAHCDENLKLLQFSFLGITSMTRVASDLCNLTTLINAVIRRKQDEVLLLSKFMGGAN